MMRDIGRWRLLANAVFAAAILALGGFGLHQVAGRQWRVQPTFRVRVQFESISGLEAGHRVRLQGIDAGVVEGVVPPLEPGRPVELILRIDERLRNLVRRRRRPDCLGGTGRCQGGRADPGQPDAPMIAELGTIASERPIETSDLLKKAASSLAQLDAATLSAEKGLGELTTLTASIRRGEGSLGKLVQDESLYQNLVEVSHRGERAP